MKKDKNYDIGILMLKINKDSNFFIEYNRNLTVEETNILCNLLNYDSIHSQSLFCKLNKKYNVYKLSFENDNSCCKL